MKTHASGSAVQRHPISNQLSLEPPSLEAHLGKAASGVETKADLELGLTAIADADAFGGLVIQEGEVAGCLLETPISPNPPYDRRQFWRVFGSTFITIFLAELGDKTQVSTLLMSAEFHAPWVVFAGAATALITTSLLGVLVGRWLSTRLSAKTLDTAAGITLALLAIGLFWDVMQG